MPSKCIDVRKEKRAAFRSGLPNGAIADFQGKSNRMRYVVRMIFENLRVVVREERFSIAVIWKTCRNQASAVRVAQAGAWLKEERLMRWWIPIIVALALGCQNAKENGVPEAQIGSEYTQGESHEPHASDGVEKGEGKTREFIAENADNIANYAMKFAKSRNMAEELRRLCESSVGIEQKKAPLNAERLKYRSELAEIYSAREFAPIFVSDSGFSAKVSPLIEALEASEHHGLTLDLSPWLEAKRAYEGEMGTLPGDFRFTQEEETAIADFIEREKWEISDAESMRRLVTRLVAENTPVSRLREAVLMRARELDRRAKAAALLELRTADLSMRFASAMAFENRTHLTDTEKASLGRKPTEAKYAAIAAHRTADWFRDLSRLVDAPISNSSFKETAGTLEEERDELPFENVESNLDADIEAETALNAKNQQDAAKRLADRIHSAATVEALVSALYPSHPAYRLLVEARRKYAALPDWGKVTCGAQMRVGKSYKCVPALKKRLAMEGYYDEKNRDPSEMACTPDSRNVPNQAPPEAGLDVFDKALKNAIGTYYETHQMDWDPEKGYLKAFWTSLNVPRAKRLAQIDENLRRWHHSYLVPSDYYIFINIPEFYGEIWREGKRVYRFPVVVGNAKRACHAETKRWHYINATPMMHARMLYVEYNPYWNVPPRIEQEDYIKKIHADPTWLQTHGFEYYTEKGYTILRQLPSESNALGRVKFIFPNEHSTFMHDSPQKGLFRYAIRAFSHGCMRVWEPLELAKRLLEYDGQWRDALATEIDDYVTRRIVLKTRFDVFLDYFTVKADETGLVYFFADPYHYVRDALEPPNPKSLECVPQPREWIARPPSGDDVGVEIDA